ncbi:glyoxalase [Novosphingobium sp. PC22D]|uniref:VOC family protein n=1 Tax=Novosphingobium sp. PC22D TaxID=1962403 RepID=UPI000BEF7040|nr:VOC family protein [Novosphingobium sp. PC22D]PEQ13273.1 glyoxalase [Novosphingobium sp. PC22D]
MPESCAGFIWYELMTSDPQGAAAFYGAVIGWKIAAHADPDPSAAGMDYRMIVRDDGGNAGGVLRLTEAMLAGGARPCWMPYLQVADVDAAVVAIEAEGGSVQMPAADLPVGRIAMLRDPQGVPIYVMAPKPPPGAPPGATSDVFDETATQRVRWNELASPDQPGSMAFYARHFGFAFDESMPMGELGDYCFIDHGGKRLGAIMRKRLDTPVLWDFYFGVPSAAAAKRAIEENGGTVESGPHEVPGGDWVVTATDPQGARFGVVGPLGE